MKTKPKIRKIKGYMTMRDGELLGCSTLLLKSWDVYSEKAPLWQKGDESIPVTIIY